MITTFVEDPQAGEVSRRTAYIRNNGPLAGRAELHDPVEPVRAPRVPGAAQRPRCRTRRAVQGRHPDADAKPAGFGCPCRGGEYDTEGNRTAVRPSASLDRYEFSIVDGNLILGERFSVGQVDGTEETRR